MSSQDMSAKKKAIAAAVAPYILISQVDSMEMIDRLTDRQTDRQTNLPELLNC
jgi:hypothetical protein